MTDDSPSSVRKLVFVNRFFDPDESATSQLLTDLTRGLVAGALPVHVLCSRQLYTNPKANLPPRENLHGVRIHRVPTTRYGRMGLIGRFVDYASFYVSAAWTLLRLLKSGDVVISETDPPLISILAAFCARLKGATLVNWQQDVFPEVATHLAASPLPRWFDKMLRNLRDRSMRGAATNVVISHRMLEYFAQRGIPRSKLCVIENWADADAITPKPTEASALRARLELTGKFVVCYSGNLGRAHEFDTLVAAAHLLRSDTSIIFLIIGGGAKMESLRRAVAMRTLDNFRFLPYQPRAALEDSLAAGDVHLASLLPALEGLIMPSKLYGILAAGRPLIFIGDSDGDIARVIAEAQCGVTVAIRDAAALAAAIRRLQSDPAMCAAMGARARDLLLDRYAMRKAVERWFAVLALRLEDRCAAARSSTFKSMNNS
jgi:colanic acid biosynthesis glycosyl transferase WcaI